MKSDDSKNGSVHKADGAAWPPLARGLVSHAGQGSLGFHMPGHHQGRAAWGPWRELLGEAVFSLDLTELPGLDNLQDPQGIIRAAADEAASFFGAGRTHLLINGASAGIMAVLLAACREGDRVLVPRNCHQSVMHGLVLSGAAPAYLPVSWHPGLGLPGLLQTERLQEALDGSMVPGHDPQRPDREPAPFKLLVLLHPNYYGLAGELAEQVALAHQAGVPVLADEAHGAHFCASSLFPAPALKAGADYAVHGAHKTLGAFTQAAFLHCRNDPRNDPRNDNDPWSDDWNDDLDGRVARALRLVQTSSPSYLLMASLDIARYQLQQSSAALWEAAARLGIELRQEISRIPGLNAPGEELFQVPGVAAYDPARLTVNVSGLGITGFAAAAWLRAERRILVEMADLDNLVYILGPGDAGPPADALLDALRALVSHLGDGAGGDGSSGGDGRATGCGQVSGGSGAYCGYDGVFQGAGPVARGGSGGYCGEGAGAIVHGVREPSARGLSAMMRDLYDLPIPRQALTPRQAFFAPSRAVPLVAAAGKIAAGSVTPYPPGVPVICPGEVIGEAALEYLAAWRRAGGAWRGGGHPSNLADASPGVADTVDVVEGS